MQIATYTCVQTKIGAVDSDFCTYFILFEISKQINKMAWQKLKRKKEFYLYNKVYEQQKHLYIHCLYKKPKA